MVPHAWRAAPGPEAGANVTARYDLIVFDFDGTLADSLTWFRTALGEVVDKHGLPPICEERAEALRGLTPKAIMDELGIPNWKIPFIAADVRARAAENVDQINLFEGIDALLSTLSDAGVQMAVVSSNGETAVREVLGPELTARFDQFACGAALFGKASVFRKVIRKAGTTPQRTLSVGDEIRDIDAAREVGCTAGAVTWGFATPDILLTQDPDFMFDSPGEVAEAVLRTETSTRHRASV